MEILELIRQPGSAVLLTIVGLTVPALETKQTLNKWYFTTHKWICQVFLLLMIGKRNLEYVFFVMGILIGLHLVFVKPRSNYY
jgi:hypothetical protein